MQCWLHCSQGNLFYGCNLVTAAVTVGNAGCNRMIVHRSQANLFYGFVRTSEAIDSGKMAMKFVFLSFIGEDVSPMKKAKNSTLKGEACSPTCRGLQPYTLEPCSFAPCARHHHGGLRAFPRRAAQRLGTGRSHGRRPCTAPQEERRTDGHRTGEGHRLGCNPVCVRRGQVVTVCVRHGQAVTVCVRPTQASGQAATHHLPLRRAASRRGGRGRPSRAARAR